MRRMVFQYIALIGLSIALWAGLSASALAEVVLDYFTYDSIHGTEEGQEIKYVQINLNEAWEHLSVSSLDPDLCDAGETPNPVMSVMQNLAAPNCDVQNLQWWRGDDGQFNAYRFVVNANFFQIPPNPYDEPCGKGLGVTIRNGAWIAGQAEEDRLVHDVITHTLIVYNQAGSEQNGGVRAAIVDQNYNFDGNRHLIQAAISGYRFMDDGNYIAQPEALTPAIPRPRTAVGLNEDGNTLIFISINVGERYQGESLQEGDPFYQALGQLGAHNALNLDGGGSAQLVLQNLDGQGPLLSTMASDTRGEQCQSRFYRPAPIVFSVE